MKKNPKLKNNKSTRSKVKLRMKKNIKYKNFNPNKRLKKYKFK